MGQRTQIILQTIDNGGGKKIKVYHLQWGNGRQMPLAFMELLINDYKKDNFRSGYSFHEITSFRSEKPVKFESKFYEKQDFSDVNVAQRVFSKMDNNNGGMVVIVQENKPSYLSAKFKVGFVLGPEECYEKAERPFSRWVSPEEYLSQSVNSGYSDKSFRKLFNDFLKYFNVEILGQESEE